MLLALWFILLMLHIFGVDAVVVDVLHLTADVVGVGSPAIVCSFLCCMFVFG